MTAWLATALLPEGNNPTPYLLAEEEHAAIFWNWYNKGLLLAAYQPIEHIGTVLVLRCTDVAEANALLATLPVVQEQLVQFALMPVTGISELASRFLNKEGTLPTWWPA